MFENFFTLFKILSVETSSLGSSIALSRPLKTENQIDSKNKRVIWIFLCLEKCLKVQKRHEQIVFEPNYQVGFDDNQFR